MRKLLAGFLLSLALASSAFAQGIRQQVPIPLPQALGGTGSATSGLQRTLCTIRTANFNTTADQACPIAAGISTYSITAVYATNCSANLTLAVGGVYPTTAKGGTAIVANTQVYTALTASTVLLGLTVAAAPLVTRYTAATLYLSLTTGQGGAATCDFYVVGVDLT